jgi:putative oxidoreductase
VRRLFSTFARGWPGVGLLLLRIVAGAGLIAHGFGTLHTGGQPIQPAIFGMIAIGDGTLLLAGLWTPIAGFLVILLALWDTFVQNENLNAGLLLAAIGAALALVGPGACSLDARLFGWKRIDIGH